MSIKDTACPSKDPDTSLEDRSLIYTSSFAYFEMRRDPRLQLRTSESLSRTESVRLGSEVTDLHKLNVDLQRRHTQFQHELRRRDREFERLQVCSLPRRINNLS